MALSSLWYEKGDIVISVLGKRLRIFVPILKYLQLDFSKHKDLWHFKVQFFGSIPKPTRLCFQFQVDIISFQSSVMAWPVL